MTTINGNLNNQDVAAMVAQVLGGEREAFNPLVTRFYPSVLRLCQRLLGSAHEAEDIVQEALLRAFLELRNLNDHGSFGAWIHAIAVNCARMALRRRQLLSLDALSIEDGPVVWSHHIPSPEDAHTLREVHDSIVGAINDLSLVNREVVIGFYLDGYSYAEMAQLLDVPVSAVRGRLFHGRQQLRRALQTLANDVLTPDRRQRKEQTMDPKDPELIEVTIDARSLPWLTEHQIAVLRDLKTDRFLPLWIGPFEANAIALAIQGTQSLRPLTHDLTLRLLEQLGGQVRSLTVFNIVENMFVAEIMVAQGDQLHRVESRPSDGIALALKMEAPIYVTSKLFKEYGITPSGMRVEPRRLRILTASDRAKKMGSMSCLHFEPAIEVLGKTENLEETLKLAREQAPDVILLDLNSGELGTMESIHTLLEYIPCAQIIPIAEEGTSLERNLLPDRVKPLVTTPVTNERMVQAIRRATGR